MNLKHSYQLQIYNLPSKGYGKSSQLSPILGLKFSIKQKMLLFKEVRQFWDFFPWDVAAIGCGFRRNIVFFVCWICEWIFFFRLPLLESDQGRQFKIIISCFFEQNKSHRYLFMNLIPMASAGKRGQYIANFFYWIFGEVLSSIGKYGQVRHIVTGGYGYIWMQRKSNGNKEEYNGSRSKDRDYRSVMGQL